MAATVLEGEEKESRHWLQSAGWLAGCLKESLFSTLFNEYNSYKL